MTAVAFEHAVGSRWIVSVILSGGSSRYSRSSTATLSPPAACCSPWEDEVWSMNCLARIHPRNQILRPPFLSIGIATAACMFLGSCDSRSDLGSWLGSICYGMVRRLRCLSLDEAAVRRPCDCSARRVGRRGYDPHEVRALCARTLLQIRVARAHIVGYRRHRAWSQLE